MKLKKLSLKGTRKMLKQKINRLLFRCSSVVKSFLVKHKKLEEWPQKFAGFINSWWKVLLSVAAVIVFLYYPLGGLFVEDIDTNTEYEINTNNPEQSAVISMNAFLINREVHEKMWTPNLPFFFPSYFLDNMPNFQMGIISAISNITSAMAKKIEKPIAKNEELHLVEAAKLLKYPGTIWMFSAENSLVPVPSANSQYKRARKHLLKYNQELLDGSNVFYKNSADLAYFLKRIGADLSKNSYGLEVRIREESSSLFDTKADDLFFEAKGKVYAYYLILRALGSDYKDVLVMNNVYQTWTQLLKNLEDAALLSPLWIRNGELDSLLAANHLQTMAYYELKAAAYCKKIVDELKVGQLGDENAN